MSKKLIDHYKEWMETGSLGHTGLCCVFEQRRKGILSEYESTFDLFRPDHEDYFNLNREDLATTFWGSGVSLYDDNRLFTFTPLRQTIVLLMCAMNDEL